MSSSPGRNEQLKKTRMAIKRTKETIEISLNTVRYVVAALTEEMGETQARRFLAKINIKPPLKIRFIRHSLKLNL